MEFTLRDEINTMKEKKFGGLNPCFCGIYSQSREKPRFVFWLLQSLNPCFCGIYSQRCMQTIEGGTPMTVLILVFVEFTLRVGCILH